MSRPAVLSSLYCGTGAAAECTERGAVLREVPGDQAGPRPPLLRLRGLHAQDGPPLSLGQQLCRLPQLQGLPPPRVEVCKKVFLQFFLLFLFYALCYCGLMAGCTARHFLRVWLQQAEADSEFGNCKYQVTPSTALQCPVTLHLALLDIVRVLHINPLLSLHLLPVLVPRLARPPQQVATLARHSTCE